MMQKISKAFPYASLTVFYPDISTALFARINGLVEKTFERTYVTPSLRFGFASILRSYIEYAVLYIRALLFLSYVTLGSIFTKRSSVIQNRPRYRYAISIISERQFYHSKRTFDFLIDGENIEYGDVVFIPFCKLSGEQKKKLSSVTPHSFFPSERRSALFDRRIWLSFFSILMKGGLLSSGCELQIAYRYNGFEQRR